MGAVDESPLAHVFESALLADDEHAGDVQLHTPVVLGGEPMRLPADAVVYGVEVELLVRSHQVAPSFDSNAPPLELEGNVYCYINDAELLSAKKTSGDR